MVCNGSSYKRRILMATAASALLTFTLTGALFPNLVEANLIPLPAPGQRVKIQLPESKVYGESSVPVAFSIQRGYPTNSWYLEEAPTDFKCLLDGKLMVLKVSRVSADSDFFFWEASLSGLSEGVHTLIINVIYTAVWRENGEVWRTSIFDGFSDPVTLTVDAAALRVSIVSIRQFKTYVATSLPLEFTVSEPASWLGYSLDGEVPITMTGNTTLSGLSEGTHTIIVQAKDMAGLVGASSLVTFAVETQTAGQPIDSKLSPFPATPLIVAVLVAAVVCAVLLLYFKKRKR
jgi:hypothetical protein